VIFIIEPQLSYVIFIFHALRVYIFKSNIKSLKFLISETKVGYAGEGGGFYRLSSEEVFNNFLRSISGGNVNGIET
jgi:hypothetical protein